MKRLMALILAVVAIQACGEGGGGDGLPNFSAPAPIVLLDDTWSAGPSPNWAILVPTAVYAAGVGNPTGSMYLTAGGGASAEVLSATPTGSGGSLTQFTTLAGLTIGVDVKQASGTESSVDILDGSSLGVTAMAFFTNGSAYFSIGSVSKTITFPADGRWHRYSYSVRNGAGIWSRDGVVELSGATSSSTVSVHLSDGLCGTWFDNVLVTVP